MDLEAQRDGGAEISKLKQRLDLLETRLLEHRDDGADGERRGATVLANPSPLGLFGFAIVSFLSGVSKLSGARNEGTLATTGIFIGGLAQLLTGLLHFVKNNMHSATVFSIYGLHWVAQGVALWHRGNLADPDPRATATYFALLTITTVIVWIPSFKMNKVLVFTLAVVVIVFAADTVAAATASHGAELTAGAFSCLAAVMAFYMCAADVINEVWRKVVLPVFPHDEHKHDYHFLGYVPRLHYHKSITAGPHH